MKDLQDGVWNELKEALERYVKALEENTDIDLINSLAQKIKELEQRLQKIECAISGFFLAFIMRPPAIVRMHEEQEPEKP